MVNMTGYKLYNTVAQFTGIYSTAVSTDQGINFIRGNLIVMEAANLMKQSTKAETVKCALYCLGILFYRIL